MVRRSGRVGVALLPVLVAAGACAPATTPGDGARSATDVWGTAAPSTSGPDDVRTLPRLVDDAAWVTREGERALVVTPSTLLRESRSPKVFEEAWRRVVVAVPKADTPGMRDQFLCHAAFASSKRAWYLEPARPAVGYWRTVRAGCNPGDVTDVG